MPFWERLYDMCIEKGCKPNTIAKAIGLSTATATKWKSGTIPNGEALAKIADYLGCSVDYLLGRSDESTPVAPEYDEGTRKLIAAILDLPPEKKKALADLMGIDYE